MCAPLAAQESDAGEELRWAVGLVNAVVEGAGVRTGLHMCRGNWTRNEDVLLAWMHGQWSSQYYLLENRRKEGFDRSLPAEGLLIWHVDESMNDNAHPWWPERGGGGADRGSRAGRRADAG